MINSVDVKKILINIADMFIEKEEELCQYDSVIGDGDHGITMARGAKAAKIKLESMNDASCRDYFKTYGRTLISTLGGAMGPLFGSIFLEISKACKGVETVGVKEWTHGLENAEKKIMELGGASVGQKTMLDALHPTIKSLKQSLEEERDLISAFSQAEGAAKKGLEDTIPMKATMGRAKFLQDKSIGHQDAGATSFYYFIKEANKYISTK